MCHSPNMFILIPRWTYYDLVSVPSRVGIAFDRSLEDDKVQSRAKSLRAEWLDLCCGAASRHPDTEIFDKSRSTCLRLDPPDADADAWQTVRYVSDLWGVVRP